jgi:glutamate synthase domain-containing protein 1
MCGIAGIIHRGGEAAAVGNELTEMLQALRHRGPDSTGFALYGESRPGRLLLRFKAAESSDMAGGFQILEDIRERRAEVDQRIHNLKGKIVNADAATAYAFRYELEFEGSVRELAAYIEEIDQVEILSIGNNLELVKDLGDARQVSGDYALGGFRGTHGIGHARMATESDVDIRSAHPYWAFPFNDVSLVHNGQLTNYWTGRRALERRGHRFASDCDSELIAVYLADKIDRGIELEDAMRESIDDLDGVFTYLVATDRMLGLAKDRLAAKPMVLFESDEVIVLASEEVAIRRVFPEEIETTDPYEETVRVWEI